MFKPTILSKNLESLLKKKEVTVYRLAKDTGLSKETVLNILRGRSGNPTIKNLYVIADYFECSMDELVGRDTIVKVPDVMVNDKLLAAALDIVEKDLQERGGDVAFGEWYSAVRKVYLGMLDLKADT